MPRVKRSVHARKKRRKVLEAAKGYWGLKKSRTRYAKEQVEHSLHYAYRDRKNEEARRSGGSGSPGSTRPRGRTACRTTSSWPAARGGDPARPQGAGRARRERPAGVRRDRRAGEVRARSPSQGLTQQREVFRSRPASARAARRCTRTCAGDSRATRRREHRRRRARWDAPLRLLGGLHYLVLAGDASWDDSALETHAEFLREFVREQSVQTNEVQRSWMLLPCFLARRAGARRRRAGRRRARPERRAEPRLGRLPLRIRRRRVGAGRCGAAR